MVEPSVSSAGREEEEASTTRTKMDLMWSSIEKTESSEVDTKR